MTKKKNLNPNSAEVVNAVIERLRQMTPEELRKFIEYRTPGIEESDMTGILTGKPQIIKLAEDAPLSK